MNNTDEDIVNQFCYQEYLLQPADWWIGKQLKLE